MWSHLTLCILLVSRAKIIYMTPHGSEPIRSTVVWSHLTLCILLVSRAKIIYMTPHGSEPIYCGL